MILLLAFVLLQAVAGAASSVEPASALRPSPAPPLEPPAMVSYDGRRDVEDVIRLSVYAVCGGDSELRCQQFGPEILRGIKPAISLRQLRCRESGAYPRRVRDCAFALGDERGPSTACRITLRERAGIHSPYWSDQRPAPPLQAPPGGESVPSLQVEESSLDCTGPLLALTREPERVDPAPATPPIPSGDLATLITADDYPGGAAGQAGITAMRLQVGSHGRIDRCTVTRSSGSKLLDERACALFRARAFFRPAQDSAGRSVAAEISAEHRWQVGR